MNNNFEAIPRGWAKTTFGNIADYINGRCFKKSEWTNTGLPIIRIENLNDPNAEFNYTNKNFDKKYLIKKGDLLFSWSASLGVHIWEGGDSWLNQHIFRVIPYGINKRYLLYCLDYHINDLMQKTHGQGMVHITKSTFEKHEILIPPLNEQKRIVTKIEKLFSELNSGLKKLEKAKNKLKIFRHSLIKFSFEGKLTRKWRDENFSEPDNVNNILEKVRRERNIFEKKQLEAWEKIIEDWEADGKKGQKPAKPRKLPNCSVEDKYEEIEDFPKGWHHLRLKDIVLTLGQGWSPKCINKIAKDNEWGIIKTTAIQNLNYLENENKKLPDNLVPKTWLCIQEGDILITRAGPRNRVGVVCRVGITRDKLILCDKAYRMRFPTSVISSSYMESLLNTPDFKKKIEKLKTGIDDSGVNITQPRLLELKLPIPPIKEQIQIQEILEKKLNLIEDCLLTIEKTLKKSYLMKQSILKKAFSGKLVQQDFNDESALILLEKIAKKTSEISKKVPSIIN